MLSEPLNLCILVLDKQAFIYNLWFIPGKKYP